MQNIVSTFDKSKNYFYCLIAFYSVSCSHPSLILAKQGWSQPEWTPKAPSKAREEVTDPNDHSTRLHSYCRLLALASNIRVNWIVIDLGKPSSLLRCGIKYGLNKFYSICPSDQ
jgi:hypothetical protein